MNAITFEMDVAMQRCPRSAKLKTEDGSLSAGVGRKTCKSNADLYVCVFCKLEK